MILKCTSVPCFSHLARLFQVTTGLETQCPEDHAVQQYTGAQCAAQGHSLRTQVIRITVACSMTVLFLAQYTIQTYTRRYVQHERLYLS